MGAIGLIAEPDALLTLVLTACAALHLRVVLPHRSFVGDGTLAADACERLLHDATTSRRAYVLHHV